MSAKTLDDFFQAKAKQAEPDTVDWGAKKRQYLRAIKQLHASITGEFLANAIKTGAVKVRERDKHLDEYLIGPYVAPELVLQVGNEEVVFSPKGTNIVGATGRMDLRGERGQKTLVIQPGGGWGIVESRVPKLKVVALSADSLLKALREVMSQ